MKQTLLLMVLALGMCSINVSAQKRIPVRKMSNTHNASSTNSTSKETQNEIRSSITKERKVGGNDDIYGHDNDGYVWYLVRQNNQDHLCGVEDIEGRLIIPIMYEHIYYRFNGDFDNHYFIAKKGDFVAAYTREGTLVIPLEKHYTNIFAWGSKGKIGWKCNKNGNRSDYLDAKGRKINIPLDIKFEFEPGSHFAEWNEKVQGYKIYDLDCNKWCEHGYIDDNGILNYEVNGKWYEKPFVPGGEQYDFEPYEDLCYKCDYAPATIAHENKTKTTPTQKQEKEQTIIIEHHRDPVPVQEWQQCVACFGSGQCPNVSCGGSGWYYIGDNARTCSRCHGSGKCTICAGKGGQYVTVYR